MDTLTNTELSRELNCRTIGAVAPDTKAAVIKAIKKVFEKNNFKGAFPETVSILQGAIVLPTGEKIPGNYHFDVSNRQKPGTIMVSTQLAETALWKGDKKITEEVARAAVAAHEAMEHVNYMSGKDLLHSESKISFNQHSASPTEQEANKVAREVIKEMYGRTVYFVDESPPILYLLNPFV